jgi:hypothetical protein
MFQARFRRVFRPACRSAVGGDADSVKLREGRLYMYIRFGILYHMLIFLIYLSYSLKYS